MIRVAESRSPLAAAAWARRAAVPVSSAPGQQGFVVEPARQGRIVFEGLVRGMFQFRGHALVRQAAAGKLPGEVAHRLAVRGVVGDQFTLECMDLGRGRCRQQGVAGGPDDRSVREQSCLLGLADQHIEAFHLSGVDSALQVRGQGSGKDEAH